jgi:hypothetical protein
MAEIVTKERAKELGLKRYHGKPCQHGHGCERYLSSLACVLCQNERVNKWQHEHRDERRKKRQLQRAANPEAKKKDKILYARKSGEMVSKPERGTGVLLPNLKPNQCRAIIRQPVAPSEAEELKRFKDNLPKNTICCGAATVPGSAWCRYHGAAALSAT